MVGSQSVSLSREVGFIGWTRTRDYRQLPRRVTYLNLFCTGQRKRNAFLPPFKIFFFFFQRERKPNIGKWLVYTWKYFPFETTSLSPPHHSASRVSCCAPGDKSCDCQPASALWKAGVKVLQGVTSGPSLQEMKEATPWRCLDLLANF